MKKAMFAAAGVSALLAASLGLSACSGGSTNQAAEKVSDEQIQAVSTEFLSAKTGDMTAMTYEYEAHEQTAEENAEAEKAMRDYKAPSKNIIVNKAKTFYYRSQLKGDAAGIYDTLLRIAQDPTSSYNIAVYTTKLDPEEEEFGEAYYEAYLCMLLDHPEFFWLYNGIWATSATDHDAPMIAPAYAQMNGGSYKVYFAQSTTYTDFEEDVTAFNKAVKSFMSGIDLKKSDAEIARAIHDKLIKLVAYDYDVADKSGSGSNRAHTAFGALVKNSSGKKNMAVCDGYSAAYVYLLQQAGITAVHVNGTAGSSASTAGGHAWSMVKLGNDWYEVDSTWDDDGDFDDQVSQISDSLTRSVYQEAAADKTYRAKMKHFLYNVTTKTMTKYEPSKKDCFISKQGYSVPVSGSCVHIRSTYPGGDAFGLAVNHAPTAKGTKYAYKK